MTQTITLEHLGEDATSDDLGKYFDYLHGQQYAVWGLSDTDFSMEPIEDDKMNEIYNEWLTTL